MWTSSPSRCLQSNLNFPRPISAPPSGEDWRCGGCTEEMSRLDLNTTNFIVGFSPLAEQNTAHHMLLYGCETPGRKERLFSCGEMGIVLPGTGQSRPCQAGSQVLYAWARNAPELELPGDVGFMVGRNSGIRYLVLQVRSIREAECPVCGRFTTPVWPGYLVQGTGPGWSCRSPPGPGPGGRGSTSWRLEAWPVLAPPHSWRPPARSPPTWSSTRLPTACK